MLVGMPTNGQAMCHAAFWGRGMTYFEHVFELIGGVDHNGLLLLRAALQP